MLRKTLIAGAAVALSCLTQGALARRAGTVDRDEYEKYRFTTQTGDGERLHLTMTMEGVYMFARDVLVTTFDIFSFIYHEILDHAWGMLPPPIAKNIQVYNNKRQYFETFSSSDFLFFQVEMFFRLKGTVYTGTIWTI